MAHDKILVTEEITRRAIELTTFNIKKFDAFHLACAENSADISLTTDSRLLSKSLSYKDNILYGFGFAIYHLYRYVSAISLFPFFTSI